MTQRYTKFCAEVPLRSQDEEAWWGEQLAQLLVQPPVAIRDRATWLRKSTGAILVHQHYAIADWVCFETVANGVRRLCIVATNRGEPSLIVTLVRDFLKQFRPQGWWAMEWATTSDNAQDADGYGGGAVFVTANSVRWCTPRTFIEEHVADHEEGVDASS